MSGNVAKVPNSPRPPVNTKTELRINHLRDVVALLNAAIPQARDGQVFKDALEVAVTESKLRQMDIADEFGVSTAAVSRWVAGENLPSPAARRSIVSWLREQTQVKLSALEG